MKIALIHQVRVPSAGPAKQGDSTATDEGSGLRPEEVQALASSLQRLGHEVTPVEASGAPARTIARLDAVGPEFVFVASASGRTPVFSPALCAQLGLAFTGASAEVLGQVRDRHLVRIRASAEQIPTLRSTIVDDLRSLKTAQLYFPVAVGPNVGPGSHVIVARAEELKGQVELALQRSPSGVLVDEHVSGRDVVIGYLAKASKTLGGVLDPVVLEAGTWMQAQVTAGQREQLLGFARRIFKICDLHDAATATFRVGDDGRVHFLEVDACPSLTSGPLAMAATLVGLELDGVVDAVLKSAAERQAVTLQATKARAKRKQLRVGFTYNLKRVQSSADGEVDSDAEYDSPKVIGAVREAIESYGHEVVELEATPELPAILGSSGVDLVFNMAEGLRGRSREAQVPAILELLDIPYSGSDAATMSLTLDKALAKRLVAQAGFATAPFVVMFTGKEKLPKDFTFPAIVKPVAEGSSKGVLKTSVVENEDQLRELVKQVVGKYRQGALVESFLSGREFTVALLGESKPRVLPPMEIVFVNPEAKNPVYAFDFKLDWSKDIRYDRPAVLEPALLKEIERVARGVFATLGCRDIARIDLRMDAAGRVNFIEVNPLPGLSPGWSDLCLIAESAGMDYRTLIGEIIAPAIRRYRERRRETSSS